MTALPTPTTAAGAAAPVPSKRLRSLARKKQLVRVASELLSTVGVDYVRAPEVAEAAGVTRAVVYRFFPSRQALLSAVLEEFRRELEVRFEERAPLLRETKDMATLESAVRGFVEASCDAIDATGAGGFLLLHMDGPDPEIAALTRATRDALHRPWIARVASITRVDPPLVAAVSAMAAASSKAVLTLYTHRKLTRDQASDAVARGMRALFEEFQR